MYTIVKGIPLPGPSVGRPAAYPLKDMDVGDSFLIPLTEGKKPSYVQSSVSHAAKGLEGKTFVTRTAEGGIRVWRTA